MKKILLVAFLILALALLSEIVCAALITVHCDEGDLDCWSWKKESNNKIIDGGPPFLWRKSGMSKRRAA
jgi:hypothetical protein